MSKADEMFEIISYKKKITIHESGEITRIRYLNLGSEEISFDLKLKDIEIQTIGQTVNLKQLQAINEKCKELGWLQ